MNLSGEHYKAWRMDENGKYATGRKQIWDLQGAIAGMESIWKVLIQTPNGSTNVNPVQANSIISLSMACITLGFSSQRVCEWRKQYYDDEVFSELDSMIKELIENRLIFIGMNKKAAMPIFVLKNHYNYTDRVTTEQHIRQSIIYPKVVIERNGTTDGKV